jgi:hypothetical protein
VNDYALAAVLEEMPRQLAMSSGRAARADQWERDQLSARLMRELNGQVMADLIDELSINEEARRRMVRVLGDLEARA